MWKGLYSLTHSLTWSLVTHSLTHLVTGYSLTHSLGHWLLTHSLGHWLLTHSLLAKLCIYAPMHIQTLKYKFLCVMCVLTFIQKPSNEVIDVYQVLYKVFSQQEFENGLLCLTYWCLKCVCCFNGSASVWVLSEIELQPAIVTCCW